MFIISPDLFFKVIVSVVSGVALPVRVTTSPLFTALDVWSIMIFASSNISLFSLPAIRMLIDFSLPPESTSANSVLSLDILFGTVAVARNFPSLSISIDLTSSSAMYNLTLWFGIKPSPIILKSEPIAGFSGINLKDELSLIAIIFGILISGIISL